MTKFAHRPRLDLADPLAGQVHLGADVFEGPDLPGAIETETHAQDLLLALIERLEQLLDRGRHHLDRGHVEGRLGGAVLDDVTQFGVAVFAQGLGE